MNLLTISDIPVAVDLDSEQMKDIHGGRMKLPGQQPKGAILVSPDGEPVSVYVDGSLQNSVSDGFYHL
ncbi:hypothetical protein QCE63_15660 [Caballeronia sp. LZ065]|uniref:hypothetical protein n=1 Tax=Caballeronia sp. LZ065 TaxID=3038571 RepID=UPI002856A8AA|nr:hypothetical protein [Caballeronia sp. LZ065]MDR5780859.1 hypothetical protein [Caballeronia sp. LZ065]